MKKLILIVICFSGASCVDKVHLSLPASELPIIVEGMVTDQPGPDTVKLTEAYPADGNSYPRKGIDGAKLAIADETGFVDSLVDIGNGYYVTSLLNGEVGRTYQLFIQIRDTIGGVPSRTMVVSSPQRLMEAGSIDTIYYEFTSRMNPETGVSEDGFNVYINSTFSPGSSRRMLWHFMGTFTTTTDPTAIPIVVVCPDPPCEQPCDNPPCFIACAEDCECCTCWYNTYEKAPIVSTPNVLGGAQLNRVFIQYIPINAQTFFEKYRVEITQLELSEDVFDFYQAIRKQADNAGSVFQPPFFELQGNVTAQSGPRKVIGAFAASATTTKAIYIPRSAVPYKLTSSLLPGDCRGVSEHATLIMPPYWE